MNEPLLTDPPSHFPTWLRSAALIALLMLSGVVFESHAQTRILAAQANQDGMLVIRGIRLTQRGQNQPAIYLGDRPLEICAQCANDSYVMARIPGEIGNGRHALRFASGDYRRDFYLTIPKRPVAALPTQLAHHRAGAH